jgi:hypothetical protein
MHEDLFINEHDGELGRGTLIPPVSRGRWGKAGGARLHGTYTPTPRDMGKPIPHSRDTGNPKYSQPPGQFLPQGPVCGLETAAAVQCQHRGMAGGHLPRDGEKGTGFSCLLGERKDVGSCTRQVSGRSGQQGWCL